MSRALTGRRSADGRGGARFDVTSGNHTLVTDQPVKDGGGDAGMSPVELFVGSLASCVAYFAGRYCGCTVHQSLAVPPKVEIQLIARGL